MPILIILACATIATIFSAVSTWRAALSAAEDALKLQSLGIAASIEASLQQSTVQKSSILSTIISEGGWEGIAYLSLHTEDGTIALHSNINLIGRRVQDEQLASIVATGKPTHHYVRLATDERVFVMDIPLHVQTRSYILRLALHTYPAETPIRQARVSIAIAAGVVVVLWVIGFFLFRLQQREDRLRASMAERERFAVLGEMASVLAHEIRNPLGSIKGFAQYLQEQHTAQVNGIPSERMESSLGVIITEAERLEILTDDLLLYSRTDDIQADHFEFCTLLEEIIAALGPRDGVSTSVSCDPPVSVFLDRNKLRQILINLIENGRDAVGSGGTVTVTVRTSRATIGIDITDNGPGMTPAVAERAFEPFFTTKTRGTGLGLPITKRLVELLQGTISFETSSGEGTRFSVVLPLSIKDVI